MFKKLSLLVGGMDSIAKIGVIVVLLVAIVAGWNGYMYFHDSGIKKEAIKEIVVIEKGVRDGDIKRVEKAREIISSKSDCNKLSVVYGSDRCEGQQGASKEGVQEASIAKGAYFEGSGQNGTRPGGGSVWMGGLFPSEEEKRGMQALKDRINSTGFECSEIELVSRILYDCEVFCDTDAVTGKDLILNVYCAGEDEDAR